MRSPWNVLAMAIHYCRRGDNDRIAPPALLGAFGKFYDSSRAFRPPFFPLAARVRFSELVERDPAVGATRGHQFCGECCDVGSYPLGHGSSRLQHSLAETSGPKSAGVVHADESDAAGDRLS